MLLAKPSVAELYNLLNEKNKRCLNRYAATLLNDEKNEDKEKLWRNAVIFLLKKEFHRDETIMAGIDSLGLQRNDVEEIENLGNKRGLYWNWGVDILCKKENVLRIKIDNVANRDEYNQLIQIFGLDRNRRSGDTVEMDYDTFINGIEKFKDNAEVAKNLTELQNKKMELLSKGVKSVGKKSLSCLVNVLMTIVIEMILKQIGIGV